MPDDRFTRHRNTRRIRLSRAAAFLLAAMIPSHGALAEPAEKPGLPEIQQPFAALPRAATFKVADSDSDWVLIGPDAVWVAGQGPLRKIDPQTNREVMVVPLPGTACAGLAAGFGSLWVPICSKKANSVLRVDAVSGAIVATIPMGPPFEAGIAAGKDAVWFVVDGKTLIGIDPATNQPARRVTLVDGSQVPAVDGDTVWVTSTAHDLVTAVDARTGAVVGTVSTGPKPHFLAAGGGAIWTLNQGDGSVTRIDAQNHAVLATIALGLPGRGGDIAYGVGPAGKGLVVVTAVDVPLTIIDAQLNRPLVQWKGPGGDSLRFGHGAIWLADYLSGNLFRIDPKAALGQTGRD
ncbi:PQQ-binding-like beta-propeller repeat protein [Novosphingobium sp.]|uniref:outer membrane protein assembly factor BamB family protein n=1 Tax=Novosphingobium sp. TaxID=1874826 RepID=UPI003BAB9DC7